MPKHGACNLSSINLSEYVYEDIYTREMKFDYDTLVEDIPVYVKAMDQIVTENSKLHALKEQREFATNYRNIGIGFMGIADMLIKLNIPYGSHKSINLIENIAKTVFKNAVIASAKLSKQLGAFPKYTDEVWESSIIHNVFTDEEIEKLKPLKLRNASILSIAPTGSIATMLGISTGIEPYYSSSYTRKTVSLSGEGDKYYKVEVPIFKQSRERGNTLCLVTSEDVNWKDRIDFQSALQMYVDTAISSTINLKNEVSEEEISKLYLYAWEQGLKGITIFRSGCREGILTTDKSVIKETKEPFKLNSIMPISRKSMGTTHGSTYCKKCACGTLYITTNLDKDNNLVEVFTHTSKGGICQANMNAVTRMISLGLRSGIKIDEILDQLKGINCPACSMSKAKGNKIDGLSCPDIISTTIKQFYTGTTKESTVLPVKDIVPNKVITTSKNVCPECGEELISEGGCFSCQSCGYSHCG